MAALSTRAARAYLAKKGVTGVPAGAFAASANELDKSFDELLYLIGLMYDGTAVASARLVEGFVDAEQLKLLRAAK